MFIKQDLCPTLDDALITHRYAICDVQVDKCTETGELFVLHSFNNYVNAFAKFNTCQSVTERHGMLCKPGFCSL